jgi:hypothetical protein
MAVVSSKLITASIPTPPYLKGLVDDGVEECSGMVFQVLYGEGEKALYVGLAGGRLTAAGGEEDGVELTPVGNLVLDILLSLPIAKGAVVFAEVSNETAADDVWLAERVDGILERAMLGARVLILGDFSSALDGKVTPLLNPVGVMTVDMIKVVN